MKGLIKVLSCDLAILKEWRIIGMLKGYTGETLLKVVLFMTAKKVDRPTELLRGKQKYFDVG